LILHVVVTIRDINLQLLYADIAVGFFDLMFKRQHTESPYDKSMTVSETVFTKWTNA